MKHSIIQDATSISRRLLLDESGFVASAELALIITLMICAVAVGWSTVKDAIATELNDVSEAIGAIDQTYRVVGHSAPSTDDGFHGVSSGFGFVDAEDTCDCQPILVVAGIPREDPSGNGPENQ